MTCFLIHRPIAVTMTLIAFLVLGIVASLRIPVSLLPDTDIPKITVQVNAANMPARELENSVVKTLRRNLMQTAHLDDIRSETRDGSAVIELDFEYGTDIDYAFIEANEKIDRALQYLPRDIERPRAIKASATDIPAFYLNLTLNQPEVLQTSAAADPVSQRFIELSNFAFQVIRKRIEQLPAVAMVDMSGMVYPELLVIPYPEKLAALGIDERELKSAIANNHLNLGNLVIRDGQYQFNVRFASTLRTKRDLENIYLKIEDQLFQLKELALVQEQPQPQTGMVAANGQAALSMAIIKRSDVQMGQLKTSLQDLLTQMRADYPEIRFEITRDQTRLLDYSINNLSQSLLWSAVLAFLVMFFFLRDFQSPLLIGITIPAALMVSLLGFFLLDISINIISLSGLVLGVGMMVDNSIIVIDNINQHQERIRGLPYAKAISQACILGVKEIFRPLLSSVLTTCAVFIPLIFLSGMAGALFYDQAMAVTIGLVSSLVISVTILPVYYRLLYLKPRFGRVNLLIQRLNRWNYEKWYDRGFTWVMRHQLGSWLIVLLLAVATVWLYLNLPLRNLPQMAQQETMLYLNWNAPITMAENKKRVQELKGYIDQHLAQQTSFIGVQQFLLDKSTQLTAPEALLYLQVTDPDQLEDLKELIRNWLFQEYGLAVYEFREAGNIFNLLFEDRAPDLEARLQATADYGPLYHQYLQDNYALLQQQLAPRSIDPLEWQEQIVLEADPVRLLTYGVSPEQIYSQLKSAFNDQQVLQLADNQYFVPVKIGSESLDLPSIIANTAVYNQEGDAIYLRNLVKLSNETTLKAIMAGQEGEYIPVAFEDLSKAEVTALQSQVREVLQPRQQFEANFTGSYFSNQKLLREMAIILAVSLLLLYFILAAQFESLKLPLIVLVEVPIDIFGAFLLLWLFGSSINLMSLIGIIVMSGIIINDSILKIDTINQLRKNGYSLLKALHIAGRRRLKPILMTSLTTMLALTPFLLSLGMGADLQKPLALAVIGGMLVGTVVSVYLIPVMYYGLVRNNLQNRLKRLFFII